MDPPFGCFDRRSPAIKAEAEAEGEGNYASYPAHDPFQDLETDQGLTLPPEIQSSNLWLSNVAFPHHVDISALLDEDLEDLFGDHSREDAPSNEEFRVQIPSNPPGLQVLAANSNPHLSVLEALPCAPSQLASRNPSPVRPMDSPSDSGYGHSISIADPSAAMSNRQDEPGAENASIVPGNHGQQYQPNQNTDREVDPQLGHDHRPTSITASHRWESSVRERSQSSCSEEERQVSDCSDSTPQLSPKLSVELHNPDIPLPSIEKDSPPHFPKRVAKTPFWMRPFISKIDCDKCGGQGQIYNTKPSRGPDHARTFSATQPQSRPYTTSLHLRTIALGDYQAHPTSEPTHPSNPRAEPDATMEHSAHRLLVAAIEYIRELLPDGHSDPRTIERDTKLLDILFQNFTKTPDFRRNACHWAIKKIRFMSDMMEQKQPANLDESKTESVEDLRRILATERAQHAEEIRHWKARIPHYGLSFLNPGSQSLRNKVELLETHIQNLNTQHKLERTRNFIALQKCYGNRSTEIKTTITPTVESGLPRVSVQAVENEREMNPYWLCCLPCKSRESPSTRHPQCLAINSEFYHKYNKLTRRTKCERCDEDVSGQRYYLDGGIAEFLLRTIPIPSPPPVPIRDFQTPSSQPASQGVGSANAIEINNASPDGMQRISDLRSSGSSEALRKPDGSVSRSALDIIPTIDTASGSPPEANLDSMMNVVTTNKRPAPALDTDADLVFLRSTPKKRIVSIEQSVPRQPTTAGFSSNQAPHYNQSYQPHTTPPNGIHYNQGYYQSHAPTFNGIPDNQGYQPHVTTSSGAPYNQCHHQPYAPTSNSTPYSQGYYQPHATTSNGIHYSQSYQPHATTSNANLYNQGHQPHVPQVNGHLQYEQQGGQFQTMDSQKDSMITVTSPDNSDLGNLLQPSSALASATNQSSGSGVDCGPSQPASSVAAAVAIPRPKSKTPRKTSRTPRKPSQKSKPPGSKHSTPPDSPPRPHGGFNITSGTRNALRAATGTPRKAWMPQEEEREFLEAPPPPKPKKSNKKKSRKPDAAPELVDSQESVATQPLETPIVGNDENVDDLFGEASESTIVGSYGNVDDLFDEENENLHGQEQECETGNEHQNLEIERADQDLDAELEKDLLAAMTALEKESEEES